MEIQSDLEVFSCQNDLECNRSGCTTGEGRACLAWEDLTAMLPNFGAGPTRRLINGLTGYALPGRIMAVMGPSGSGKSTFLDSLTGRLSGNVVMTGKVLLNGKKKKLDFANLAYVTQQDEFLGTLTVRETITYSAMLRLPNNTTTDEIKQTVENAIIEMGLQECADNLIGNWHLRGISGGEKKRLSIALEIITQPEFLFLDEPTTGLDSASAFFVIQALKSIASSAKTIISSIHQPSSQVFEIFDDLLLLSNGQTIYFGEAKNALKFFADAGFPCPSRRNPADHFLRCINSDFDNVNNTWMGSQRFKNKNETSIPKMSLATSEIRARLLHFNQKSKCTASVRARLLELSTSEGILLKKTSGNQASWWKQLTTLTRRSFKNMTRDFGYYWLRILVFITVSICVGSIFYDVGTNYNAILARGSCGGFITGFMTFMTIGGFPSFIEEMKIFHKEKLKGHYGVGVYILSNFISSFPFLITMSFSSAPITYFMVKFHPGISHFIYAALTLSISIAIIDGCMMVVAAIVPNFLMGVIVGSGFIGIMMASAGFFQPLPQLPKIFWTYPVSYINYMSWALQGGLKNDLIGLEFEPLNPGQPKLKGEEVITSIFGFSLHHSKWWDLVVILGILIAYRLLFFFILKFKERVMPICRTLYAKITIHHMKQRPSFRLTPPFPSKRHPLTFSLSSQEGLNSPLR